MIKNEILFKIKYGNDDRQVKERGKHQAVVQEGDIYLEKCTFPGIKALRSC